MFSVQYSKKGLDRELYLNQATEADKKTQKELIKIFNELKKWTKKNRVKKRKDGSFSL